MPNLVQISVIVTEIDTHMLKTFIWWCHANLLPVSTFGHVVISASPWCIFPYNLMQDIFIQSKVIDIFRNSRWRPPPSWIFSLCEFGHSGVLIVWYLCFVPNLVQISVIVTEIDTHMLQTFIWWCHANLLPVSTFGHVVISASPCCIQPYNLIQDIFIQSKVIDIFRNSRWRPPPSWIFSLCEFGHSGVLSVWYLCSVPNLVQISVIVTEIDADMLQTSFDDVTRINFRFQLLVT